MATRYGNVPDWKEMPRELNKCLTQPWNTIATGLYYTGARAGELLKIRAKDIWQDEDNELFVNVRLQTEKNKVSHQRTVPINTSLEWGGATLFLELKNNRDDDSLVFFSPGLTKDTYLREMRRRFNEFYDGVAPHYFRHCRLTHMVTKFGYNEAELVHYAGWTDGRPSKHYMHLNVKNLQEKMKRGI